MSLQLLNNKRQLDAVEEQCGINFEQSRVGMFKIRMENGRFLKVNQAFAGIVGYEDPKELVAAVTNVEEQVFHAPADWQKLGESFRKSERIVGFETVLVGRDGALVPVAIFARHVGDGESGYCEGAAVKISERLQTVDAGNCRTAAAADNARSAFFAKMSHEVRTPLNAIMGFAEMLEADIEDERHRNWLRSIKSSGSRLLELINHIIDWSKNETGESASRVGEVGETQRNSTEIEAKTAGTAKVLVADDLEINRHLVRSVLADSGIAVIEADNGMSAVSLAAEHRPDLILMDIRMPGLDGYQALGEVRKTPELNRIPVIALTSSGMKEDILAIKESGFDDFLIRPYTLSQLKAKVAAYLQPGCKDEVVAAAVPFDGPQNKAPYLGAWSCPAGVAEILRGFVKKEWQDAKRKQNIPDILEFAKKLQELGDEDNLAPLTSYGRTLAGNAEFFDIDGMRATLNDFPRLVADILQ